MNKNTSTLRIRSVGEKQSLFSFIEGICQGEPNSAEHRLCNLMRKMDVKTAVIETLPPEDKEISEEIKALTDRIDERGKSIKRTLQKECPNLTKQVTHEEDLQIFRLSFFDKDFKTPEEIKNLQDTSLLSSSIIINYKLPVLEGRKFSWDKRTYIYRSYVVIPTKKFLLELEGDDAKIETRTQLLNHYIHICRNFECKVGNRKFEIFGTYFCQQNGITSQCAHCALSMIINNMDPEIFGVPYKKITPDIVNKRVKKINRNIDPKDIYDEGLSVTQIGKFLEGYGLNFTGMRLADFPNEEYNDWIYSYLESKYPILLIFEARGVTHVIVVFGHTLSTDSWRPAAQNAYSDRILLDNRQEYKTMYNSASEWVDSFIIHDDNFGMYQTMPVDTFKKVTIPKHDPTFRAWYALALIPPKLQTIKDEVEKACVQKTDASLSALDNDGKLDPWSKRLTSNRKRRWVLRTFVTTKETYIASLKNGTSSKDCFSDEEIKEIELNLPKKFWLSEITLPDLYSANKSKIIDFFYRCDLLPTREGKEEEGFEKRWIQIRLPQMLVRNNNKKTPEVKSMEVEKSHIPMLQFESENIFTQW